MSSINAIYQCLFCSQTFMSAAEKDVHVWRHLATETYEDNRFASIGANKSSNEEGLKFFAENIRPHFMMPNPVDLGKEHWGTSHVQPQPLPTQQPQPPPQQQQQQQQQQQPPPPTQPPPVKPKRRCRSKVSCDLCGQLFHRYALYRHRRDVHHPVEITCKLCNTKFNSEEYMQRHMQYKHGVGKNLTCGTCSKTFRSEVRLNSHQCGSASNTLVPSNPGKEYWNANYVEQKPKPKMEHDRVECEYCGKMLHIYAIYRHRRDVHNPIVCICPVCNAKYKSKEYLNRHMQSKHGISGDAGASTSASATAASSSSSTIASTSASTSSNNATVPAARIVNYSDQPKPKRKVECDLCGQFFHHYALYRHRRDVHNPIEITCDLCNTKFKSEEYMHRHMQYKHGIGRNLTCGTCNKTFRSMVQLHNHACTGVSLPTNQSQPVKLETNKNVVDKDIKPPAANNSITITCDICGKGGFDCEQSLHKHKIVFHSHPGVPVLSPHWMPPIV